MSSTALQTFRDALRDLPVESSRVDAESFPDALAEAIREPAVGVPLPDDDVSLEGSPVTLDPTPRELAEAATGVTPVSLAVADYGTVVVDSGAEGAEQVSLYPDRHVAVLRERDVVADMEAAFDELQAAFEGGTTSAVLATGPSATADMGELVYGAHGPREVHVVVVEDR